MKSLMTSETRWIVCWKANAKKNVVIGHFHVKSLRNKSKTLEELLKGKIDVCLILETKTDEWIPD